MLGDLHGVGFVGVSSLDAVADFYGETLGLRLITRNDFALVYDVGGRTLRVTEVGEIEPPPYTVFGWETDDLVATVESAATVEAVNEAFQEAAGGSLKGILKYTEEPIVSSDIIGDPHSCILDSEFTMVSGNMVKVFGWYDNEWGYSSRLVDLVSKLG